MKVNMSGVLPIIFAQTIASLPATIWAFIGTPEEGTVGRSIYNAIDTKSVLYLIVYFLLIIGFSYFYATIQFNPVEICQQPQEQRRLHPRLPSGQARRLTSLPRFSTRSPFSAPSTSASSPSCR